MSEQMLEAFNRWYPTTRPQGWSGRDSDRRRAMLAAFKWGWEQQEEERIRRAQVRAEAGQ